MKGVLHLKEVLVGERGPSFERVLYLKEVFGGERGLSLERGLSFEGGILR